MHKIMVAVVMNAKQENTSQRQSYSQSNFKPWP